MTSLTNALPLTRGIDNQISFLLTEYMLIENIWTKQVFQSALYPYIKSDLASVQRPAILCYPWESDKISRGGSQTGYIIMELHFSLQAQRGSISTADFSTLAQNVTQIAGLIQLINLNQQFTQYMQAQMPGLFQFGTKCHTDYSQVYAKESIVKIKFDYTVDLLAYQRELQLLGCDITSPDEQIYLIVESMQEQLAILNNDQTVAFTYPENI